MAETSECGKLKEKVSVPEISPREVLMLLNKLGITKVTASELKQFLLDLKTLIANDIQQQEKQKTLLTSKNTGPERLYSCPTISSKSKTTKQLQSKVNEPRPQSSGNNFKHKPQSRSKNKENEILSKEPLQEKKLEIINSEPVTSTKHYRKLKSSKNFIKVQVLENNKKSDPVSLYNYYCSMWQKYKTNLPGENSWADLRWSVREKLLGDKPTKNIKKTPNLSEEELAKRRDGWTS